MGKPPTAIQGSRPNSASLQLDLTWVKGYLDLIASGITLEQFLRLISDEIGALHPIDYCQIFFYDQEGHLAPTTTFGLVTDHHGGRLSRDELHPVTDCARTEETLAIPSNNEFLRRYPSVDWGHGPSIFIPLRIGPLVDGVFAIFFRKGQSIDWNQSSALQEAITIIAHLSHLINMKTPHARDHGPTNSDSEVTLGLSDRQMVIAKMIAQGMTNRTIARELGFSEATIRYETIKLYERLRVKNRSHAAARIHQLGLG